MNIYDSPRVLSLGSIEVPTKIAVRKMDLNKKGYEKAYIDDKNIIEEILNEIKDNKKVENIRGSEYLRFKKAFSENNSIYYLFLEYDEKDPERNILIAVQPNGYVTIEENKNSVNFLKDQYLRYKIVLSKDSIDKIIQSIPEK